MAPNPSTNAPGLVCSWCGKVLRAGPPGALVSHGICAACAGASGMFPVENLATATLEELNRLPFGVIRLRPDGRIAEYSAEEEELSGRKRADVVGKNFFREVAPCTAVAGFEGEVAALRKDAGGGRTSFAFVFQFPGGELLVTIAASHDVATGLTTVLVKASP
jgi:photoactive yellow protein